MPSAEDVADLTGKLLDLCVKVSCQRRCVIQLACRHQRRTSPT